MDHEVGSDEEQGGESKSEEQIGHLTGKSRNRGKTTKQRYEQMKYEKNANGKSAALHEIDARAAASG